MRQHLLEVSDHQIAALTANDDRPGPPIVFLHGITASVDFWVHSLPPAVRDERRWVSLSLPGHFPSRLPPNFTKEDVTIKMFSDVHHGAIRRLVGDEPVALVGWSTGGFSALNLAARHPAHVQSVLSISGFAKGGWWGVIGNMRRLIALGRVGRSIFRTIWTQLGMRRWLFDLAIGRGAFNRRSFRASPVTGPTLDGWQAAVRGHDLEGLATLFERLADLDLGPFLPEIAAPTLIVGGDRDPYIPLRHTHFLAETIPGAELRVLSRTGHMFFAEATAEYHQILIDWLSRKRADAPAEVGAEKEAD